MSRLPLALACLLVSSACYRPALPDCKITCSADNECPTGTSCEVASGYCRAGDAAGDCPGGPQPGTATYLALTSGYGQVCGIRTDHSLWCWGANEDGQLGIGDRRDRGGPVQVGSDTDWLAVAGGESFTCGIRGSGGTGTISCWGDNSDGELGEATPSSSITPRPLPGGKTWKTLAAGFAHACAIDDQDELYCWGYNNHGQLGVGPGGNLAVTPVAPGVKWTQLDLGETHSCALRDDGHLLCWGGNENAELGVDAGNDHDTPQDVDSAAGGWLAVSAATDHTCAIRENGAMHELYCWGRNNGRLGTGDLGDETRPTLVMVGDDWTAVTTGSFHSCGLRASTPGHLWCWGVNDSGQVGVGDRATRVEPAEVDATHAWTAVVAGFDYSCAIEADQGVYCWGNDDRGSIGDGSPSSLLAPARVGTDTGWTAITAGHHHACGLLGGELRCWGRNDWGQLGTGTTTDARTPTVIPGAWQAVAAGGFHTCAIDGDGAMWCWGTNYAGELGNGDPSDEAAHPIKQQVSGGAGTWKTVAASEDITCGIGTNDELYCWGRNQDGQLGVDDTMARSAPAVVANGPWTGVAVSDSHVCGVRQGGQLWCWGSDSRGGLGDGGAIVDPSGSLVPVHAADLAKTFVQITGNREHTCARAMDGGLWCWGGGQVATLGNGMLDDLSSPTPVNDNPGDMWIDVGGGYRNTCGIKSPGALFCWGVNDLGAVGSGAAGPTAIVDQPLRVDALDSWTHVSVGEYYACGIRDPGELYCWGRGSEGQTGTGDAGPTVPKRIADMATD